MMIKKGIADLSDYDFQAGQFLMIDKPMGWSSFRIVHKIRKASGVKKVGHAGTLDPLATGLLILATGKKTREITQYQSQEKVYSGTITLGQSSPSMDKETVSHTFSSFEGISEQDIYRVRDKFIGRTMQIPPMYSAIKFNGQTMYNLARKGKSVELTPREIEISSFEIRKIDLPEVEFKITCSKGTYIRALANDFGNELGCGGILSSLRRLKIGEYSVDDAFQIEEILHLFEIKAHSGV